MFEMFILGSESPPDDGEEVDEGRDPPGLPHDGEVGLSRPGPSGAIPQPKTTNKNTQNKKAPKRRKKCYPQKNGYAFNIQNHAFRRNDGNHLSMRPTQNRRPNQMMRKSKCTQQQQKNRKEQIDDF